MRPEARAQVAVVLRAARQEAGELGERHLVDVALELDHEVERDPVVVPAPRVELRMVGGAQVHVAVAAGELEQEPDLLLAAIVAACVASDEVRRHLVAQPVARSRHDSNMVRGQPHLFVELAEHRLLGRLAVIDAPLRELPGMGSYPFAPEHLVLRVEQDDADVGSEPITVDHNQPRFLALIGLLHRHDAFQTLALPVGRRFLPPRRPASAARVNDTPMRASKFFVSTLKEAPADAEIVSHQLMLRAGFIKRLSAGIYTYMPMGLRVIRKIEAIVREEMNAAGAVELLMPVVQPAELWQESGRFAKYGPELMRVKDRHDRDFVIQPTSEEVITDIARQELRSYRQLPKNFYHIQTKFRDERRPRFGVMRGREFTMKDAYSFDRDASAAQASYRRMYDAYVRIFERMGLVFRPVAADTGAIGGDRSHEFQVIAETGEDAIAYSLESGYAANVELAEALPLIEHRAGPVR